MSSHTSSGNEFPFHLVKTESGEGTLNVFRPLAPLVTDGIQRVAWMHQAHKGRPLAPHAIDAPMDPSARTATAFLRAVNRCPPAAPGVAEARDSHAIYTGEGQCLLKPATMQDGLPCPDQRHLTPALPWQQDHGLVMLQWVRWIQWDARSLLNEHQHLLNLHEIQKIPLWRAIQNILTPFNAVFGMLEMGLLGLMPKPTAMADKKTIRFDANNIPRQARILLSVATEVFLNILGIAIKDAPAGHQIRISSFQHRAFIDISFVNDLIPGREFQLPDLAGTQRHITARASAGHGIGLATRVFGVGQHGGSIQQVHLQGQQCKTTIRLLAA